MLDRTEIVHALAAMTDDEFTDAVRDARGDDTAAQSPMEKAAAALRSHRGMDRKTKASKDDAVAALHRYKHGSRN